MFGNNRDELRQTYFSVWAKRDAPHTLEPLEKQILAVMLEHPEYHAMFDKPDQMAAREFTPEGGESNPFLHLGMHLAIRDQVATNNPAGIADIYQRFVTQYGGNTLDAEHTMLEVFIGLLWETMRYQTEFDSVRYLETLRGLLRT